MNRAFSLVELSIVLVILGLLTGGILGGQALIHAAELRAVPTEYTRWITASQTFRDKYFALPGDMTNATAFWGTAAACPGNNTDTTTTGVPTCNGDGNGQLSNGSPSIANETYRFWQHLANAGLIEGQFTGVSNNANSTSTSDSRTTPNVPRSKFDQNIHWNVVIVGSPDYTNTIYFDGNYGNALRFGTGTNTLQRSILAEDAWNIDTKMDDGKPGTGNVTSLKNMASATITQACSEPAYTVASSIAAQSTYVLTNTAANCSLVIKTGF